MKEAELVHVFTANSSIATPTPFNGNRGNQPFVESDSDFFDNVHAGDHASDLRMSREGEEEDEENSMEMVINENMEGDSFEMDME